VVRHDGERYRLLCLRSFDSWDFPKGAVAQGEEPLEQALAHSRDATGIAHPVLPWGEEYRETVPFDDGRVSRYYLAQTASADVVLRQPAGHGSAGDYEYRWVTVDEAEDILPPRLALVLDWVVRTLRATPPQA
jgi:bis(5'-nucleosidyl)-tetraphosphatase